MESSRKKGEKYEESACRVLKKAGFIIKEQNFRCRQGEIDIIGYDKDCLVFVEVKYRRNNNAGTPEEAVTLAKQKKICRTADYYRLCRGYGDDRPVRYDVIAFSGEKNMGQYKWYKNAFPHHFRN